MSFLGLRMLKSQIEPILKKIIFLKNILGKQSQFSFSQYFIQRNIKGDYQNAIQGSYLIDSIIILTCPCIVLVSIVHVDVACSSCAAMRLTLLHLTVEHNKQGEEGAGRAKEGQLWLLVRWVTGPRTGKGRGRTIFFYGILDIGL